MRNMPAPDSERGRSSERQEWFATTHWSVVLAAGKSDSPYATAALEKLYRTYWYPLYAYVRRRGHSPVDAQDLVPFLAAVGQYGLFYSENQWLFNKATTNAILLQISGADHITATDVAWTWEIPWGRAPAIPYNACLLWFLDTYLKSETRPFPTNPEIYNVQRK